MLARNERVDNHARFALLDEVLRLRRQGDSSVEEAAVVVHGVGSAEISLA